MLSKRYGLRHISTGDLFLKAIRSGSKLGDEVKQYTMSGKLVPDGTTNIIVKKELADAKESGYVLDGFPRTLAQAEALAESESIDFVFYINAAQEVLISRLTKRFYCDCGDSYGPQHPPAVEGLCDSCGGMLYQREDDKPRNVLTRLEEYNSKTRELLRFYRDKLHPVDGSDNIDEVTAEICAQLEQA
jgi:adenylate kinase